jgi:hypothetical protein
MPTTIHKKFYKAGNHPSARTVGQLKAILQELPDDLRIEAGFGAAVQAIVYNHGQPDMHLELVEHEDEDDE